MSRTLGCIITSSTCYGDGAHFEFELVNHGYDWWLTETLGRKYGLKCKLVIGEGQEDTPMIIDRWTEGPLTYCTPEDVDELEAKYAELKQSNDVFRALLQRVVDEAVKKRVDWTPASNWLATSHNGNMYAIHYVIDAELMAAINSALNPQEEQDDD